MCGDNGSLIIGGGQSEGFKFKVYGNASFNGSIQVDESGNNLIIGSELGDDWSNIFGFIGGDKIWGCGHIEEMDGQMALATFTEDPLKFGTSGIERVSISWDGLTHFYKGLTSDVSITEIESIGPESLVTLDYLDSRIGGSLTASSTSNITIDFSKSNVLKVQASSTVVNITAINMSATRSNIVKVYILAPESGDPAGLTSPGEWVWLGSGAPFTTIESDGGAILTLQNFGTTNADIIAIGEQLNL